MTQSTRRLCLYRHAKSDWSNPDLNDFDRPLKKRGRKAAAFMAKFIANGPYRPDHILCSAAKRAQDTFAPLQKELGSSAAAEFRKELYLAMPEVLIGAIRKLPDSVETAMVVAHNPGLELLSLALGQWEEQDPDTLTWQIHSDIAQGMPTAALAVFDFEIDHWRDLKEGIGLPVYFGRPKVLMAE